MSFPVQLVAVHATAASTTPPELLLLPAGPPELLLAAPELLLLPAGPPELLLAAPELLLLLVAPPELLLLPAPLLELLLPAPELLLPAPASSPGFSPAGFTSPEQPAARALTRQAEATDAASKAIRMTLPLLPLSCFRWAASVGRVHGPRHVPSYLGAPVSCNRLRSIATRE
jgi:hypothetical protein